MGRMINRFSRVGVAMDGIFPDSQNEIK